MEEVRVGIVGMGIGRPNALGIARNRRGRVAALCDLAEERMAAIKSLPHDQALRPCRRKRDCLV